jgi:hypothetical protein
MNDEDEDPQLDAIVKAWSALEKKKRQQWEEGPTKAEQLAWWKREQALDGIGPTQNEVHQWAMEETARRKDWLSGPTNIEKEAYRRGLKLEFLDPRTSRFDVGRFSQRLRRRLGLAVEAMDVNKDVQKWAHEEHERREQWIKGPTEEEANAYREHIRREVLTFPPGAPFGLEQRLSRRIRQGITLSRAMLREFPSLYTQLARRTGEVYKGVRPRIRDYF